MTNRIQLEIGKRMGKNGKPYIALFAVSDCQCIPILFDFYRICEIADIKPSDLRKMEVGDSIEV